MEDSMDMYDFGWETPTNIYHYNETQSFIPKTYTVNINELRKAIIKEYNRAKTEETRIDTKVDKNTETIKKNETKTNKKIAKVETQVVKVEKKVEKVEKRVEKVETRVEEVKKTVEKEIATETKARETADEKIYKYFNSQIDSIELVHDSANPLRYYLQVGDNVKGDITLPEDASLQSAVFNPNTNKLEMVVGTSNGKTVRKINVDLTSLKNAYSAGYGLTLKDNVFELNYNEENPFLFINKKGELDISIQIKSGNTGSYDEDIWSFYIVGKDGIIDPWTSSKVDLHPIKEYIDQHSSGASEDVKELIEKEKARAESAETYIYAELLQEFERAISAETALNEKIESETTRAISAETALDTKIENLAQYIYDNMLTKQNIHAGDNIVLTDGDTANDVVINVRMTEDIEYPSGIVGIADEDMPKKGDTLNKVAEKLAKVIIENADAIDGEEIDANIVTF